MATTDHRTRAAELAEQAERSRRRGDHSDARQLIAGAQVWATLALSTSIDAATAARREESSSVR